MLNSYNGTVSYFCYFKICLHVKISNESGIVNTESLTDRKKTISPIHISEVCLTDRKAKIN